MTKKTKKGLFKDLKQMCAYMFYNSKKVELLAGLGGCFGCVLGRCLEVFWLVFNIKHTKLKEKIKTSFKTFLKPFKMPINLIHVLLVPC